MIRIVLKLLVYLSILTSTRTTSSYLDPQSLVNFRRSSVSAQQQQLQPLGPEIYERDAYEWQPISEKVDESSSYFIPRLVNANSMVYTQLSNIENKRPNNKKSRKSKKGSGSKQLYENHIKRKSNLSFNVDHSLSSSSNSNNNDEGDVAFVKEIVKHSNNNTNQPSNQTMATNEYPAAKIDPQHERELQELFGIEGARKYQEYQLKQQMLNQQLDIKQDDIKDVPQKKRDSSLGAAEEMQDVSGAMINQMMSRTTRRQREYDVPLIQCPPATDGMERFACPTPDRQGRYRCIDDHVLCDGFIDCPEGADEDRQACMFYKTTKAHLDVLADALLRWARGR